MRRGSAARIIDRIDSCRLELKLRVVLRGRDSQVLTPGVRRDSDAMIALCATGGLQWGLIVGQRRTLVGQPRVLHPAHKTALRGSVHRVSPVCALCSAVPLLPGSLHGMMRIMRHAIVTDVNIMTCHSVLCLLL